MNMFSQEFVLICLHSLSGQEKFYLYLVNAHNAVGTDYVAKFFMQRLILKTTKEAFAIDKLNSSQADKVFIP